jgi:hypothetical protein
MSMPSKLNGLVGAAALAAVILGSFATSADAKGTDLRFRCKARGPGQIALHATYQERARTRGVRSKFNAEFEARPGGNFNSGQKVAIEVDAVPVGTVVLTLAPSGELSGELEFDSKPQRNHTPFPANFPDVAKGTMVEAKVGGNTILGCELQ